MITTLISTVAGFVTGATATTLLSNKSGKERRDDIKNEIDEFTQDIQAVTQSVNNVKTSLNSLATVAKELIPEAKKDMDDLVQAATFQLNPRIEQVKKSCQTLQQDLENTNNEL